MMPHWPIFWDSDHGTLIPVSRNGFLGTLSGASLRLCYSLDHLSKERISTKGCSHSRDWVYDFSSQHRYGFKPMRLPHTMTREKSGIFRKSTLSTLLSWGHIQLLPCALCPKGRVGLRFRQVYDHKSMVRTLHTLHPHLPDYKYQ